MSIHCPYDPAHIMPHQSFVKHLSKCKSPNKHLFTQCKYDLMHIIRKENIQKHYQIAHQEKYKPDISVALQDDDWFQDEEEQKKPNKKQQEKDEYKKEWIKNKDEFAIVNDSKCLQPPQQNWDQSTIIKQSPITKMKKKKKEMQEKQQDL